MQNCVLTSEEVKEIIDNLYSTIGVRMNVNLSKYPYINSPLGVNQLSFMDDCKLITDHLELPICVSPIFSSNFQSTGVVLNDSNSTSGIGAQIHIPSYLPWYKTDAMNNFSINVTVPPEALAQGHYYLLTQLSHEFSHIYLHSRRDPQRESEWATDLCALMMGFTPLWLQGRKHTSKKVNSTQTITYIQTQGYLSDIEFDFAVKCINKLRSPFEQLRNNISSLKQKIQLECNDISKYLENVCLLHVFHYKHSQKSFKNIEDAVIFSKLAQSQYRSEIEELLNKCKNNTNVIIKPLQDQKEFYEKDKKWMENSIEELTTIEMKLEHKLKELKHDYEVIIQNIDVEHYTRVFNNQVKTLNDGVREANKIIQLVHKKINLLNESLAFYKKHKKEPIASEIDAKTLSLICNAHYIEISSTYIKKKQEEIDGIVAVFNKAQSFYSVDDEILLSQITELNNLVSTLDYCLKEQKSNIKVVIRNLNLTGKIKCIWNCIFTSNSRGKQNK